MTSNIYQTPESTLTLPDNGGQEFYVVSPRKFLIMFIGTFGGYFIYWIYRNWKLYNHKHDHGCWPIMRTIFMIFFIHSLFGKIDQRIKNDQLEYRWQPTVLATLFVLIALLGILLGQLITRGMLPPWFLVASIISPVLYGAIFYRAQLAINLACGDQLGASNNKLTGLNYFWLVLGLLNWTIQIFALYFGFTMAATK